MNPLVLPLVAAQGMWVKSTTKVLPPADGPSTGVEGADRPGQPLRVGVLGESTAAGCGAGTHTEGFPGSLARELSARADRPVSWEVVGQHGATGKRVRHRLLPQLGGDLDVAVLLAGANDVMSRRTPADWEADLRAIVDGLAERAGQVVVVGIPPFSTFPSLPGALRRYLAHNAGLLDAVSSRVCEEHEKATWVNSTDVIEIGADFFAEDRFHPCAHGYQQWARTVVDYVKV